jgi:hypothetical protein
MFLCDCLYVEMKGFQLVSPRKPSATHDEDKHTSTAQWKWRIMNSYTHRREHISLIHRLCEKQRGCVWFNLIGDTHTHTHRHRACRIRMSSDVKAWRTVKLAVKHSETHPRVLLRLTIVTPDTWISFSNNVFRFKNDTPCTEVQWLAFVLHIWGT